MITVMWQCDICGFAAKDHGTDGACLFVPGAQFYHVGITSTWYWSDVLDFQRGLDREEFPELRGTR